MRGGANTNDGLSGCNVSANCIELRLGRSTPAHADEQHIGIGDGVETVERIYTFCERPDDCYDAEILREMLRGEFRQRRGGLVLMLRDEHDQLLAIIGGKRSR